MSKLTYFAQISQASYPIWAQYFYNIYKRCTIAFSDMDPYKLSDALAANTAGLVFKNANILPLLLTHSHTFTHK